MTGKMKNFKNKQFLIAAIGDEVLVSAFYILYTCIAHNYRTPLNWNG